MFNFARLPINTTAHGILGFVNGACIIVPQSAAAHSHYYCSTAASGILNAENNACETRLEVQRHGGSCYPTQSSCIGCKCLWKNIWMEE